MGAENPWWAWPLMEAWQWLIHIPFLGIVALVVLVLPTILGFFSLLFFFATAHR